MAGKTESKINHFDDGFLSYPNLRVRYPEEPQAESEWLAGWYKAKRLAEIELQDLGIDTFLWEYKTGE